MGCCFFPGLPWIPLFDIWLVITGNSIPNWMDGFFWCPYMLKLEASFSGDQNLAFDEVHTKSFPVKYGSSSLRFHCLKIMLGCSSLIVTLLCFFPHDNLSWAEGRWHKNCHTKAQRDGYNRQGLCCLPTKQLERSVMTMQKILVQPYPYFWACQFCLKYFGFL